MKHKILHFGFLLILIILMLTNCSTVSSSYIKEGYTERPNEMIKRVIVIADSSKECSNLKPLMLNIIKDILELKKNYMVYEASTEDLTNNMCEKIKNAKIDGVIKFTIDYANAAGEEVDICIHGKLLKCKMDDAQWKAVADDICLSNNEDLINLTSVYKEKYGNIADTYAAPIFTLIQDLIKTMPDPFLTDDEEMEKIELETFEERHLIYFKHLALFQ